MYCVWAILRYFKRLNWGIGQEKSKVELSASLIADNTGGKGELIEQQQNIQTHGWIVGRSMGGYADFSPLGDSR